MTLENLLYNNNIHVIFLFVDFILKLLKNKVFSEPGSSSLTKEKATYVFFRNLLEEVEGRNSQCYMLYVWVSPSVIGLFYFVSSRW